VHKLLRSPILILWGLVGFNLIVSAVVPWILLWLTPRGPFARPDLNSPAVAGTLVFVAAELLLLGIWTALFDPRLPVRWLSVIGIIAVAGCVFAADFNLLFHVFYPEFDFWIEYRYVTVIASSVAFVIVAFIVLLIMHCLLWLPRSYLGLRFCFIDHSREMPRRQFGTSQALLWMGLVGTLCGVARAFSGQDWFLQAVIVAASVTMLAAALVVPTLWAVQRPSCNRWAAIGLVLYVTCLSIVEGAIAFPLITVPGLFFMTWACLIVLGFNLAVVGAVWFNAWTLSTLGVRVVIGSKSVSSDASIGVSAGR
jgi:hypothetical protein